ncbi:ATP-binding protein [bacterium]|nr:ATP-binding protein [bacterium]
MMYIKRELEQKLNQYLPLKEAIAIVGPRQVGKTTLMKHIYDELKVEPEKKSYLTFEDRTELNLFNDINDFKDRYKDCKYVFVDEFQYADNGGQKLKFLYDTTSTKYIISGSSSLELTFKTGKYMVGRLFTFHLWPFSFREFLHGLDNELYDMLIQRIPDPFEGFVPANKFGDEINRRLEKYYHEYILWGGYPAVVLSEGSELKRIKLQSILDAYLLREIKSLLTLATDQELLKLAKNLANQIGGLINYNKLCQAVGLNYQQLKKHLEILRKTYIIDLVTPYFTNRKTELLKNPKAYFIDLGFRNYLINDFREFMARGDMGNAVENAVFMALKRAYSASMITNIKYWRTKSKAEVDFIEDRGNTIIPVEMKYSRSPAPGKSFHSFLKKYSPPKGVIITRGDTSTKKIGQTEVSYIPAYYL